MTHLTSNVDIRENIEPGSTACNGVSLENADNHGSFALVPDERQKDPFWREPMPPADV
jgi:hypothetical protein